MSRMLVAILFLMASSCGWAAQPNAFEDVADEMRSAYFTGNKLLKMASDDKSLFYGYVSGVHDAMKLRDYFCVRDSVTIGQIGDIILNFLTAHPESRDRQAQILVRDALVASFPCAGKAP